ncbi:cytochrome P450 [Litorivita sp. NS0012-18]|uniref:cytochrome P450 n=1 Tax=Litorivita sp. NS0012-18 TaxID=3127655 RepID=UPI0031046FBB
MNQETLIEGHKAIAPPESVPVLDIDPYSDDNLTNRTYFSALHEAGPFAFIPKYSVLASGRYDVVKEVFSDHERFVSSRGVGLSDFAVEEPWRPQSIILEVDPPYHSKTRKVILRGLSPKVVRALKDDFKLDAERLIGEILTKGDFEAVVDIAEAFPSKVFPEAVGIKDPDPRMLIDFGAIQFNAIGPDNALRAKGFAGMKPVMEWILSRCSRDALTPDGIGSVFYEAADNGEITHDEATMLVRAVLAAGIDTTVTGIGNALWCLATHPEEYEKLKADPEKMALPAFEETLRFTSPVQAFYRTAAIDTEVAGVKIVEGTKILCCLGAANMDPDHWDQPNRYDISRQTAGHLALGVGVHVCVGQNIARAEGQAVLRAIAERVERIELTGKETWRPNNAIHALDKLPLRFIAKE